MEIEKKMACWLKVPFDSETQQAVQSLANGTDSEALHDAFYKDL